MSAKVNFYAENEEAQDKDKIHYEIDIVNYKKLNKKMLYQLDKGNNLKLCKKLKENKKNRLKTKLFYLESSNIEQTYFFGENIKVLTYLNIPSYSTISIESNFLLLESDIYEKVEFEGGYYSNYEKLLIDILKEIIIFQSENLHHGNICINNIYVNKDGKHGLFDYFHRMFKIEDSIDLEYLCNISPEEIQGKEVINASDMYQIGQILKFLINCESYSAGNDYYFDKMNKFDYEMKQYADKLTDLNPYKRPTAKEMYKFLVEKTTVDVNDFIHNRIDKAVIYNNALFEIILLYLPDVDIELIGDLNNFICYYYNKYVNDGEIKYLGFILHLAIRDVEVLRLLKEYSLTPFSIEEQVIVGLTGKYELNFYDNSLNNEQFKVLINIIDDYMKDLKVLNFGGNKLDITKLDRFGKVIEELNRMEKLSIFYCGIGNEGIGKIVPSIKKLANIKSLNLERNKIDESGIEVLCESFTDLKHLINLNLSFNPIGSKGVKIISKCSKHITKLKELNISHCKIATEGGKYFKVLSEDLNKLEVLNISYNSLFNDGGMCLLSSLQNLPNLVELDISYNYMKAKAVNRILYYLRDTPKLHILDISGSAIKSPPKLHLDESGIEWIVSDVSVMNLKVLYINDNNLDSSDIVLLKKYSSSFTDLEEIGLSSNHFDDIDLIRKCIGNMIKLKKVKLRNNSQKFHPRDISDSRNLLPNINFEFDEEEKNGDNDDKDKEKEQQQIQIQPQQQQIVEKKQMIIHTINT